MSRPGARGGPGGVFALAVVLIVLAWWTHGFRAFTTDGIALARAGPVPYAAPALSFLPQADQPGALEAYRGKYVLLTFIYLHCPDVCHMVTARLWQAYRQLGDMVPERLVFMSLSLDPERDDADTMSEHWRLLGGADGWVLGGIESWEEQSRDATLARLGVWVARMPDGRINHAASSFLIDPGGEVVAVFRPEVSGDSIVSALRSIIQ